MLIELDITNLAVVDHARITFGPGLNVLTGETGAGKSIVIDAVGLLVGGRADAGMIRSGAAAARVEGFFQVGSLDVQQLQDDGLATADDDVLIVSREISSSGRAVCRINGRAVPIRTLQAVGERLVDIHGQGAHLSLLRVAEHVELLDRWGALTELRRSAQSLRGRLRRLQRELADLSGDARELTRRADLLTHQIGEIAAARLDPGEEEALRHALRVQAGAQEILQLAARAYGALSGEGDEGSCARDLLGVATQALGQLAGIDADADPLGEQAGTLAAQLEDLAANLRTYRERIEYDPGRLAEVEERLGVIFALKRKYGSSIDEILAFAEGAEAELRELQGRDQRIAGLEAERASLLSDLRAVIAELSERRRRAAESLRERVVEELATLGMAGRFEVQMGEASPESEEPVEFLLSLNPGEPPRPLVKIASGGETSRVMLAIKAALTGADPHPTLVFDEIDSGIGGRVGEVVGGKLWQLGRHSQVLAVTHLPQIAAFGDVHLRVEKLVESGRTVTRVNQLTGESRITELSDMFGSDRDAGRLQAAALLDRAGQLGGR
jgi:DNA repair protein RecN (Recombination protein N)